MGAAAQALDRASAGAAGAADARLRSCRRLAARGASAAAIWCARADPPARAAHRHALPAVAGAGAGGQLHHDPLRHRSQRPQPARCRAAHRRKRAAPAARTKRRQPHRSRTAAGIADFGFRSAITSGDQLTVADALGKPGRPHRCRCSAVHRCTSAARGLHACASRSRCSISCAASLSNTLAFVRGTAGAGARRSCRSSSSPCR